MKKIAILASDNMMPSSLTQRDDAHERDEQMKKLYPAFLAQNMRLDIISWKSAAYQAKHYDAILPLFVWDYFDDNEAQFIEEMEKVDTTTNLYNPIEIIKWNSKKSYLNELEKRGAPVIRTINVDSASPINISKAFDTLSTDRLVIKPLIGAGAWRQVLYNKGDTFPSRELLPPGPTMMQPFLPSVKKEGEYSLLFFGNDYSHALIKKPKSGDYRIQSLYGGTEETYSPTKNEIDAAQKILNTLPFEPLYARVDLLRGNDGQLKLIELEMIEPYLYLSHSTGTEENNMGAQKLASALKKKLSPKN
ncbi:MAG: hypothetical protein P8H55_06885 [Hellea sp.]|nr:hypothetical protein [Hellea sp.]MDG1666880.1 hypothetical protein [Hellea sp.]|tara:strand:- start:1781 stop:2695 length:915 start_codon:yes stop_codon:yes gene_type:complete